MTTELSKMDSYTNITFEVANDLMQMRKELIELVEV